MVSATDHASTSAVNVHDDAVLVGKQNHTSQTWITRVRICVAVVETGDLIRPGYTQILASIKAQIQKEKIIIMLDVSVEQMHIFVRVQARNK